MGKSDVRWDDRDVVSRYRQRGVNDPGEAAALAAVGARAQGAVLDLGVGTGRTTGVLAAAARSYTGVDLAPRMVATARARHPGVDLRVGDARDLTAYDDGAYDLVVFSFNALDSLDHAGRSAALAEMARVLAADGRLVLSSLNRDGVSYDEKPWTIRSRGPVAVAKELARLLLHPVRTGRGLVHHRTSRLRAADGPDWSMRPMRAHEFRFTVLFATVPATVAMLSEAGLRVVGSWSEQGTPVDPTVRNETADWVHYVCAKRP